MKYAYEVQSDATKAVHAFADEATRAQWVAACSSARGILSGNSREVKAALYRDTVIVASLRENEDAEPSGQSPVTGQPDIGLALVQP